MVILPEQSWPEAAGVWRRAEELGFDHAWTYDHLAWRSLRDRPWFAAIPTLTAAATVTERVRLGPLVASPNFRHPVPFAKEVVALDDISGGRLTLGLGAGGTGWDATMLGQDDWSPRQRADRFLEFVDSLDLLLREPAASFDGRDFIADEARTYPGCVQRPRVPFAIAATGPAGMSLAAQYGSTWVTMGDRVTPPPVSPTDGVAMIRTQMAQVDEACTVAGRDPATLDRLVLTGAQLDPGLSSPTAFADTVGAYAEAGVTDLVVHWPRADEPYRGDLAMFERAVEHVVTSLTRAD